MAENNKGADKNWNPEVLACFKLKRMDKEENYHCHKILEICIILSGRGQYRINDVTYDVKEGDILFFFPGTMHQSLPYSCNQTMEEFFLALDKFEYNDQDMVEKLTNNSVIHANQELWQSVLRLTNSMISEAYNPKVGQYFMLRSYATEFIMLVLRKLANTETTDEEYSLKTLNKQYIVDQVLSYFENHYADKVSLDMIADYLFISPFYLTKLFKAETGDTPINCLINIRLEKAKELLEDGTLLSIKEIASNVGYSDAYHFSKLFKKKYGFPPSSVRTAK